MATLVHTAPGRRQRAAVTAFGRYWRAVQESVSHAFCRIADAAYASRSRQAQREISQYFADRGMKLTDATEREMESRFMSGSWNVRR